MAIDEKAAGVFWRQVLRDPHPRLVGAEGEEIGVEILRPRHERPNVDAIRRAAFAQLLERKADGGVVVARDIEPAQFGRQDQGGEMRGGYRRRPCSARRLRTAACRKFEPELHKRRDIHGRGATRVQGGVVAGLCLRVRRNKHALSAEILGQLRVQQQLSIANVLTENEGDYPQHVAVAIDGVVGQLVVFF